MTDNKYVRVIEDLYSHKNMKVDVYSVLLAFNVTDPIMAHLAKKALACGIRGHKNKMQDLLDIKESIERAIVEEKRAEFSRALMATAPN